MRVVLHALAALALALGSCGEPEARTTETARAEAPDPSPAVEADPPVPTAEPPAPVAEAPDFDAPMPDAPCPDTALAAAHRSHPVPASLAHAVALRSEDGRFVRVAVGDAPLERDERGRFVPPTEGHARFELEAIRRRRGPLEPGPLRAPDSRRGALTHVRVLTAGPILTFGHRDIGTVELTHADAERVCGRVDLDDGFGRVRGAFTAPVVGALPDL